MTGALVTRIAARLAAELASKTRVERQRVRVASHERTDVDAGGPLYDTIPVCGEFKYV